MEDNRPWRIWSSYALFMCNKYFLIWKILTFNVKKFLKVYILFIYFFDFDMIIFNINLNYDI